MSCTLLIVCTMFSTSLKQMCTLRLHFQMFFKCYNTRTLYSAAGPINPDEVALLHVTLSFIQSKLFQLYKTSRYTAMDSAKISTAPKGKGNGQRRPVGQKAFTGL